MQFLYEEDGTIYARCEVCGRTLKFAKYDLPAVVAGVACFCGEVSSEIKGLPEEMSAKTPASAAASPLPYFETVYREQPLTRDADAPVALTETAILKDTVDNRILLRNTFQNVGEEAVVAVAVRIVLSDVFGEQIGETAHVYQDFSASPGASFGAQTAIDLPDNARRAVVVVEKAVTQSGNVWTGAAVDDLCVAEPLTEEDAVAEPSVAAATPREERFAKRVRNMAIILAVVIVAITVVMIVLLIRR